MRSDFKQPFWITENPPIVWGISDGAEYIHMECENTFEANFYATQANLAWQKDEYGDVDGALWKAWEIMVKQTLEEMADAGHIIATEEFRNGSRVYVAMPDENTIVN